MERALQPVILSGAAQTSLPLDMLREFQRLRTRYAKALAAAQAGDYARAQELRTVSRVVGHLLAREARKSLEERGGLRMLDLSLAVDRYFPELRGWTQYELHQRYRERIRQQGWAS